MGLDSDYNILFKSMHTDLSSTKIPLANLKRAELTVNDFECIYQHFEELKAIGSDKQRELVINKLTQESGGGGGLEDTPDIKTLEERVNLFAHTYLKAKQQEKLDEFFTCFSRGDACLSGRTDSLCVFAASLENLDIKKMADPEKQLFLPVTIVENYMIELRDEKQEGELPTLEEFKTLLSENLEAISAAFHKSVAGGTKEAGDFLGFLEDRHLIDGKELIDWPAVSKKLINDENALNQIYKFAITSTNYFY